MRNSAAVDPVAAGLLTAAAVRQRCGEVFEAGTAGRLAHFAVHLDRLDEAVELVMAVTREEYPAGDVPVHSRWRHFETPSGSLWEAVRDGAQWASIAERLRAEIDLVVVSVLLDAGAGDVWRYRDAATGQSFTRSEGLAVASLRMFAAGTFSADRQDPLRCDGAALAGLTPERLADGMQADADNPLVGLDGRVELLRSLGRTLGGDRPSALVDDLALRPGGSVAAADLLAGVLRRFNTIWPGRLGLNGVPLGDVWRHPAVARGDASDGLVPFHKLSQWLTYSLLEPLEAAGVTVTELDGLTGLAEYRNGGLFIDMGVLVPRVPASLEVAHDPADEMVVEWRALTVVLLDRVAARVRERTGEPWPLARVLQGGTWTAGRRLARDRRPGGAPPIRVASDGTVF